MDFTPSKYQQKILDCFTNTNENILVNALAGSGKSSTICLLIEHIDKSSIYIATGAACNSGDMNASAALAFMRIPEDYIRGEIRLSYTLDNTVEEMIQTAKALKSVYKDLTNF